MNNQRRRSIDSPNLSSILPHDLVVEILLRLPVRSLLRFKSVCKSWLSLISDPQFGKSHYDLAAAAPTHRCLTKRNDSSEIESLDIDAPLHNNESSAVNLKFPLSSTPQQHLNDVLFMSSCRGFILVADNLEHGDAIVWNPSTGAQRRIAHNLEELIALYPIGFGYDKSTDDYLLVFMEVIPLILLEVDPYSVGNYETMISNFSLKTNSWFYPEGTYAQYVDLASYEFNIGSFLNDALHWLVTSYETNLHVIIAFDLVQRTLSEIPLSQTLASQLGYKEYHLRVMGECLSLCYPGDAASTAEIWMMKDYKVHSSWYRVFVFSTYNIPRNVFYPICLTKHGEIFGSNGYGRLMILNDKGWLQDLSTTCPEPDRRNLLYCGMYRESLLSLPNDLRKKVKMTS